MFSYTIASLILLVVSELVCRWAVSELSLVCWGKPNKSILN